jgi:endo-alpha-1,4-polygalactosaminidase (GH114 family)
MKTLRSLALVACLTFGVLDTTSCVQRVPLTTAQTVQLNSAQAIAVVAEANKSASTLVISLNAAKLLDDDTTREILNYTKTVAIAGKAVVAVQQSSQSDQQKAAAVLALLQQLTLPAKVQSFVNQPGVSGEVATLVGLIRTTVTGVQAMIGGK